MQAPWPSIRAFLQVALSIVVLVGAIIGNQVLLLLSAMAVVALLVWEARSGAAGGPRGAPGRSGGLSALGVLLLALIDERLQLVVDLG